MVPARAAHFRVLRNFLNGLHDARSLEVLAGSLSEAEPAGTRVLALGDARRRAVWVMGAKAGYGKPVTHTVLHMRDVPCEKVRVRWWNDVTGELLQEDQEQPRPAAAKPGSCELSTQVPAFVRHVAGQLEVLGPSEGK
jgi:hypothetical protein